LEQLFTLEAVAIFLSRRHMVVQNLERDLTPQPLVEGAPDHSHAAETQLGTQLVLVNDTRLVHRQNPYTLGVPLFAPRPCRMKASSGPVFTRPEET
jgi:hypothetical protein